MKDAIGYTLASILGLASLAACLAMFLGPVGIALGLLTVEGMIGTMVANFILGGAAAVLLHHIDI